MLIQKKNASSEHTKVWLFCHKIDSPLTPILCPQDFSTRNERSEPQITFCQELQ